MVECYYRRKESVWELAMQPNKIKHVSFVVQSGLKICSGEGEGDFIPNVTLQ